jgi:hypothetical protein
MKKAAIAFLILALAIALANTALAQSVSLGVQGGVNLSGVNVEQVTGLTFNGRNGYNVSALARFGIDEVLAVQLQAMLTQKGTEGELVTGQARLDFKQTYLEFPLLAVISFPSFAGGRFTPRFVGGPEIAFEVDCNVSVRATTGDEGFEEDCEGPEVQVERDNIDLGIIFGAGLDIAVGPGAITLDVAYDLGMKNLSPEGSSESLKHRTWMFTAGYLIPLK